MAMLEERSARAERTRRAVASVHALTEELLNSLTHGLGLVLSIAGGAVLVTAAWIRQDPLYFVSACVFAGALVLMYAASVLYHSCLRPSLKRLLRTLDHIAIYLLIAGTYTPFLLVSIGGGWGTTLLYVVWGLALGGIVFKILCAGRLDRFAGISTGCYLLMGWLIVVAVEPLLAALPLEGVLWLAAGGLFYSGGVLFFVWESLPYNHAIWHLFVIGGSVCHYVAVLLYA